jgi:urocanate reductase
MNKLKRILALILILYFVLTFSGCGKTETETIKPEEEVKEEAVISFTPGTYTGKGVGFSGEVVIDVTFSEDAITDIKLVSSMETDHVGTPAFDIMFEAIKTHTSTGVDAVSGATLTSNAVLRAVEDAAAQAGCDKNNLRVGKISYELNAGEKIFDTFDVVVVGAGGAGITAAAAAAQNGASVCIIEKEAEVGGNTLVSGCSFQAVLDCLVWDPKDPDATTGVYEYTGETFEKSKSDKGRLDTLRMILNWSEEPFNERVEDPDAIKSVNDYNLPNRGVHPEYLETLKTLKQQIRAYLDWAEPKLAAGAKETDLTLFSTVELHIFQTYYGGLRLNNDKTKWIYSDYDLVHQLCTEILPTKEWLMDQGSLFQNAFSTRTLIGCLWQRINSFDGGMVSGEKIEGRWGTYFAVPLNTIMNADSREEDIIRVLLREFDKFYRDEIRPRMENTPLTFDEVINLASIVEKEALLDEERDEVAKVFLNRLEINMKLQSCATVNYANGVWKERLTYDDIEIDSPYNTYVIEGLPPTPINSPGKISIIAVLEPADVDYLYFVAKGDGSHYFSNTYDEHIDAAEEYLR